MIYWWDAGEGDIGKREINESTLRGILFTNLAFDRLSVFDRIPNKLNAKFMALYFPIERIRHMHMSVTKRPLHNGQSE